MESKIRDLAETLKMQGTQIANIGKELNSTKYAVISNEFIDHKRLLDYEDAISKAVKSKNSCVIIRVMAVYEKKNSPRSEFGYIRHALHRMNGSKVKIGKRLIGGLIRCTQVEYPYSFDFFAEKFIEKI